MTKGLYSVLLGDATLANMTVIPNSVFNNAEVHLRVWFNDGPHGSQLHPRAGNARRDQDRARL